MANIAQYLKAIMEARYGKDVRQSIHDAIDAINTQEEGHTTEIQGYIKDAEAWAKGTKDGEAVPSSDPTYHNNAKYFSDEAAGSASAASSSETNAAASALTAEAWAKGTKNGQAVPSSDPAYENNAEYWKSQAYYWYLQAKSEAESISGALRPMGTIEFASLPSLASASEGDMYNISDAFQTTADFAEGAGHDEPAGSNVYKTSTGKWDILAGSPVSGVKGSAEANYRTGNVDITPANIGLGNVDNESITPLKNDISWYGTCSTAAATTAKIATSTDSKFSLVTGAKVRIKFTYTNTASAPTLNVDSKGAKSIKAYSTTAPTIWWNAGDVVDFTYDGTNWIMGATQGEVEQLKSDLTNKATSEVTNYTGYSVAIVGDVVTVSGRTPNTSYSAGSAIVSDLPAGAGGYLPVIIYNPTTATHNYGYFLNGKLYTLAAISGGTAHFTFSYVKGN